MLRHKQVIVLGKNDFRHIKYFRPIELNTLQKTILLRLFMQIILKHIKVLKHELQVQRIPEKHS